MKSHQLSLPLAPFQIYSCLVDSSCSNLGRHRRHLLNILEDDEGETDDFYLGEVGMGGSELEQCYFEATQVDQAKEITQELRAMKTKSGDRDPNKHESDDLDSFYGSIASESVARIILWASLEHIQTGLTLELYTEKEYASVYWYGVESPDQAFQIVQALN